MQKAVFAAQNDQQNRLAKGSGNAHPPRQAAVATPHAVSQGVCAATTLEAVSSLVPPLYSRYSLVDLCNDASAVNVGMFIVFILFISCCLGFTSTIIIRRHLGNQEREFLGHIDADERLFRDVRVPISESEDHIQYFSHGAQGR